jgi:hypothetical protein
MADTPHLVIQEIRKVGRPKKTLTEEQIQARKEKKNEKNRIYYEQHKDVIRSRSRNTYDPERKAQYYEQNQQRILQAQKELYHKKINEEKLVSLRNLYDMVENDQLKRIIQIQIDNHTEIKPSQVHTFVQSILAVLQENDTESVDSDDERLNIMING